MVVRGDQVRLGRHGCNEVLLRRFVSARGEQPAEVGMGLGKVRLVGNRFPKVRFRQVGLSEVLQGDPQVVVGWGMMGILVQRPLKGLPCRLEVPGLEVIAARLGVDPRVVRPAVWQLADGLRPSDSASFSSGSLH